MLRKKYHDKPASLAESGKKPSTLVKSSLESFELSFFSFKDDFLLRAAAGFLALCISLHLEPLEHLPVVENSSHSRMCFLLHCHTKERNNTVLTVNNYTANDTKDTRSSKQRIISGKSGHLSTRDNKCTPAQGKMSRSCDVIGHTSGQDGAIFPTWNYLLCLARIWCSFSK